MEYYVDAHTGSDMNDGRTESTPFRHFPGMVEARGLAATVTVFRAKVVVLESRRKPKKAGQAESQGLK
jgi:CRISPR/Cas system CMR-associated protein Cmr5 small subunit